MREKEERFRNQLRENVQKIKELSLRKKVKENTLEISAALASIIIIMFFIFILSLTPITYENQWEMDPLEENEVVRLSLDLLLTDKDFQIIFNLKEGSGVNFHDFEIDEDYYVMTGTWEGNEELTREQKYNITILSDIHINKVFTTRVQSYHFKSYLKPYDEFRLRIYLNAHFFRLGNVSIDADFESTLDLLPDEPIFRNDPYLYLDLYLKRTSFEQFSAIFMYFLTLVFSGLLVLPESKITLQQKAGATFTFLFALYTTRSSDIQTFSILGIYQLLLTLILFGLIFVNGFLKMYKLKYDSTIRTFYACIFYFILVSWNNSFCPNVLHWRIPNVITSQLWNNTSNLLLIISVIISIFCYLSEKKNEIL